MDWTELRTGEAHVFLWMGKPVTGILIDNAYEDRTWYTFRTKKSSLKVPLSDVVSLASPESGDHISICSRCIPSQPPDPDCHICGKRD